MVVGGTVWVEGGGGLHRGEEVIVIDNAVARGEATVSTDLVRVRVRVRGRSRGRGRGRGGFIFRVRVSRSLYAPDPRGNRARRAPG